MEVHSHTQHMAARSDQEKQALLNRLKRIEGQVRGIQKMIDDDRYCVDVLVQISAVNAAMKGVGFSMAERHMKHCVSDAVKSGNGDETIDELMNVMKQFAK